MPSIREVCSAGRYDLHHGILYNGGYRLVARELYRPPSYPRVRPKVSARVTGLQTQLHYLRGATGTGTLLLCHSWLKLRPVRSTFP